MQLLIGNDNTLTVTGVRDEIAGSYINDATVTATVKTLAGVAVSGQTFPLTLSYVASSNGNYRGNLENDLALSRRNYLIEITAISGAFKAFWKFQVPALHREPSQIC